jgi:hypothetical protein
MSVLFSRLVTNESYVDVPDINQGMHMECNATMFVDEHYNNTNDEFNQYLLEGVRLMNISLECGTPMLVVESLSEVIGNIVEWFKRWLKKFRDFAMKILRKIYNFFVKGETSVVNIFEKDYRSFKEFTVQGYEYTINGKDANMTVMNEFMNQVNSIIVDIAYTTPKTLDANTSKYKDLIGSTAAMDVIRGKILNLNAISQGDFKKEAKAAFRNGSSEKTTIVITPSSAVTMCKKYHLFKDAIEACKKSKAAMEKECELVIAWMEGEPMFMLDALRKSESDSSFRNRQMAAIHQVYQGANLTAKNIQYAFDTYYSVKLDMLNEAIQFYLKTIKTAYLKSKVGE